MVHRRVWIPSVKNKIKIKNEIRKKRIKRKIKMVMCLCVDQARLFFGLINFYEKKKKIRVESLSLKNEHRFFFFVACYVA